MVNEYMEETECYRLNQELRENLVSYQNRSGKMSEKEWLEELILKRCPHIDKEQAEKAAEEIVESLIACEKNLISIETAAQTGASKEKWLESRLQESAIGMSPAKYSEVLQQAEAMLYEQNQKITEALSSSSDGHILLNSDLKNHMTEHAFACTVELQRYLAGKTIKVGVQRANRADSMEVLVTDTREGTELVEKYQMKFGEDAKATIHLIEEETYPNQKIIVPSEQLLEIEEYFCSHHSCKLISDHIELNGVKGKAFTIEELKELYRKSQKEQVMTAQNDYYATKEYAHKIGKQVGVMALQMAAVTTGMDIVSKVCQGNEGQTNELAEHALKTEQDNGVKAVTSGTLYTIIQTGGLVFLKNWSCHVIANLVFAGMEHAKIVLKIAQNEVSHSKGLEQTEKVMFSMIGGFGCIALEKEVLMRDSFAAIMGVGIGLAAGMIGYAAGANLGDIIYCAAKKLSKRARDLGMKGFRMIKHRTDKVSEKPCFMTFA